MKANEFSSLRSAFYQGGFAGFQNEVDELFRDRITAKMIIDILANPVTQDDQTFSKFRRLWADILEEKIERLANLHEQISRLSERLEVASVEIEVYDRTDEEAAFPSSEEAIFVRMGDKEVVSLLRMLQAKVEEFISNPEVDSDFDPDDTPEP